MQIAIVGEYEITLQAAGEPALVMHHVVRGYDVVALDAAATAVLRALIAVPQKRIRELGGYRLIQGAGGDLTIYDQAGRRACYLTGDQCARLGQMLDVSSNPV